MLPGRLSLRDYWWARQMERLLCVEYCSMLKGRVYSTREHIETI